MDSASVSEPKMSDSPAFPHRRWKDHPVPGVDFPDATTFTSDARWMRTACEAFSARLDKEIDLLAGIDIGGLGFIDIRKVGSIRADVVRSLANNYELGNGIALSKGQPLEGREVAIIDDCLMTGGTALAAAQLLRRLGARCTHALFVFELEGLGGHERLTQGGIAVHSLQHLPPTQPK